MRKNTLQPFSLLDLVIGIQSIYYLVTGLWPFVHIDSFQAVTGPKPSLFLLHITSILIILCSLTLMLSLRKEKTREILFLALSLPVGFMIIEILYRSEIRWVYFLDFAIQAILFAALIMGIYFNTQRKEEQIQTQNN